MLKISTQIIGPLAFNENNYHRYTAGFNVQSFLNEYTLIGVQNEDNTPISFGQYNMQTCLK